MAVAVLREVVLVYDEPETIVEVPEEPPVPVDDPDEIFHCSVWPDARESLQPTQNIPELLVCIDNSMS